MVSIRAVRYNRLDVPTHTEHNLEADSRSEHRIAVVAAVIEQDGRFLLARRRAGTRFGGQWEFPGGKMEPGESRSDTLRREIREELGVETIVRDAEPVATVKWDYDHGRVELVAVRAEILSGEPAALDHDELGWFAPAEMEDINLMPADRPVAHVLSESAGP
jgi:8-oxo-dGTP diphosphatase